MPLRTSSPTPSPERARPVPRSVLAWAALTAMLGAGCSLLPGTGPDPERGGWVEHAPRPDTDGPGDPTRARLALDASVSDLPKSQTGNAPSYSVFGQQYAVMDTAAGFSEQGVASWYGAKFHGRHTSSGEPYDMHQMTAAHKHLPLPTFVRVTRTDTGQSVVVKVNDRGPFVDDRIIDLSYGAAARLDMLDSGTAPVSIEALSTHRPGAIRPVDAVLARTVDTSRPPASTSGASGGASAGLGAEAPLGAHWIQIGAFSDEDNARASLDSAAGITGLGGRVELDARDALYRVRLGPVSQAAEREGAIAALELAGVGSYTMVPAAH